MPLLIDTRVTVRTRSQTIRSNTCIHLVCLIQVTRLKKRVEHESRIAFVLQLVEWFVGRCLIYAVFARVHVR